MTYSCSSKFDSCCLIILLISLVRYPFLSIGESVFSAVISHIFSGILVNRLLDPLSEDSLTAEVKGAAAWATSVISTDLNGLIRAWCWLCDTDGTEDSSGALLVCGYWFCVIQPFCVRNFLAVHSIHDETSTYSLITNLANKSVPRSLSSALTLIVALRNTFLSQFSRC